MYRFVGYRVRSPSQSCIKSKLITPSSVHFRIGNSLTFSSLNSLKHGSTEDQLLLFFDETPHALSPLPMEEVKSRSTTTMAQGETNRECTDMCLEMTSEGLPGPSPPWKATSNKPGEIEWPCCLDLEKAHQPMDLKFTL